MTTEVGGAVARLTEHGIDIDGSARRRAEYSYDASNYRVRPEAVAFPTSAEDVVATVREGAAAGTTVIARGGGTSMAGNAVGAGIILDLSRYLTGIGELDEDARTVVVEAGAVLSDVQRHVERLTDGRFTFAPDPSSRSRATIGGSIANDACGNHSVAYGRMSDHVVSLDMVSADGHRLTATDGDLQATDPDDDDARVSAARIKTALRSLRREYGAELREEFGRIPRQVSGYHLAHLLPDRGFDIARALVGSEGTCAIVVAATVRIVPKPTHSRLLVVGYDDIVDAARDVPLILEYSPSAVEGLDEMIVATMVARRGPGSVAALPEGRAWLLIEFDGFDGDDPADTEERASSLAARLVDDGHARDGRAVTDLLERAALWRVREDGAGLSSRLPDGTLSWPGWEDSAVAPDRLADYLGELRSLMATYSLHGVMYGHFGAGCMHVRITFDLETEAGRAVFSGFTEDAARLVVAHGGSLSGEHGDGRARSALLPLMYSPRAMRAFAGFKHAWDPTGVLNPGSIVDAAPVDAALALAVRAPGIEGQRLTLTPLDGAHRCIGVGRCRSDHGGFMCPSYRATHDEKDSTRGRARVLQEMLRTAPSEKEVWRSPEVKDALDLCLSCKACSTDCPTGVDMASYKTQFLDGHYAGRLRPIAHYSLGWLPRWLKITGLIAPLVNLALRSPLRRIIARAGGLAPDRLLPAFRSAGAWRAGMATESDGTVSDVVLLADTFTRAFRPHIVAAAQRVLTSASTTSSCNAEACCGLTWISTGQLGTARRLLAGAAASLDDGTDRPIVVLEPSCAAALRKDLPELVPTDAARRVSARVRSFAQQVEIMADSGWRPSVDVPTAVTVQGHCHEYAVFGTASQRRALSAVGVADVREANGCCGVAGNFGFEAEHFDVSMKVAEQSLVPALAATGADAPVLTDGFSCHMQVRQLDSDRSSLHLAELLDPAGRSTEKGKP